MIFPDFYSIAGIFLFLHGIRDLLHFFKIKVPLFTTFLHIWEDRKFEIPGAIVCFFYSYTFFFTFSSFYFNSLSSLGFWYTHFLLNVNYYKTYVIKMKEMIQDRFNNFTIAA